MSKLKSIMSVKIAQWKVSEFVSNKQANSIKLSPEIQRRKVWADKDKMMLIDSIARGVPIGAITLYEVKDPHGYNTYEVIDGKQRLSTIFSFMDKEFEVDSDTIDNAETDELSKVNQEGAKPFYGKPWDKLAIPVTIRFAQYEIPVFIVDGDRANAVQAFTRMNRNSYVLKPQEIRNAVFAGTAVLKVSAEVCDTFISYFANPEHASGFVELGVMSSVSYDRMQDIQFASELLLLAIKGNQHRRDTLTEFYQTHALPGKKKELEDARDLVLKCLKQIAQIFSQSKLVAYHLPSNCENDFYAIVSVLVVRKGFSTSQMKSHEDEILKAISEFYRQVYLYIDSVRQNTPLSSQSPQVENYGRQYLGGQQNGLKQRQLRSTALAEIVEDVVVAQSTDPFSDKTRALIWARSETKECARCNKVVAHKDFEAGHILSKAKGGLPTISNGQLECRTCNRKAGTS